MTCCVVLDNKLFDLKMVIVDWKSGSATWRTRCESGRHGRSAGRSRENAYID